MGLFTKPTAVATVIPPTLDEALGARADELRQTEAAKRESAEFHTQAAERAAAVARDAATAATAVEKAYAVVVEAEQKAYAILAEAEVTL